jgi:hypothetical protein
MAGYFIASIAFVLAFALGATGLGRPRIVMIVGAVLGLAWLAALGAQSVDRGPAAPAIPFWLLAGLVALLYVIWCGGLWLGLRLRRVRTR